MVAESLPKLLERIQREYPDVGAQYTKDADGTFHSRSFSQLYKEVQSFAAGLKDLGVERGEPVGLISENRQEWLVSDLGILSLGAVDVPRGNDSMPQELAYILSFPECKVVIVENAEQLKKVASVRDEIKSLKTFIVLDPSFSEEDLNQAAGESGTRLGSGIGALPVLTYAQVIERGGNVLGSDPGLIEREVAQGQPDDLATIIFTSGTTGVPKGVMLTHGNFLHQVGCIPERVDITPGDVWLAVLPVWHSFERIIQYVALGSASGLAYSKPIGKIMLGDFQKIKPRWMASVPRIWEAVRAGIYRNVKSEGGIKLVLFNFFVSVGGSHKRLSDMMRGLVPDFRSRVRLLDAIVAFLPWLLLTPLKALGNVLVFGKIKEKLGGNFIAGVSGGGALPPAVDSFFGAAGILLLEGYGLTETGPVLAVRHQHGPVPGTVGTPIAETEVDIRSEDGVSLGPGRQGIIFVRGPQVMRGYFKRQDFTDAVLSKDGWLDTGDLGMVTHRGEVKITGRAKDTVVLLGGENIEPLPIEQKMQESDYIDHAVVVGQDQKYLGALVVPNGDAVEKYADENHVPYMEMTDLLETAAIKELITEEINGLVSARNGFKSFERVYRTALIAQPFTVGDELSAKQEIKRHVIAEKYKQQIQELFA